MQCIGIVLVSNGNGCTQIIALNECNVNLMQAMQCGAPALLSQCDMIKAQCLCMHHISYTIAKVSPTDLDVSGR
jgi:hypothetical protein